MRRTYRKPSNSPGYEYEIKEVLGDITPVEDLKTHTIKRVLLSLWEHDGVVEEGVDIRRHNPVTNTTFGGIRLTIEEAHRVCDILLEKGYGSTDVIEKAYEERIGRFNPKGGKSNE